jgi:probable F420-dependent oxidoreductase
MQFGFSPPVSGPLATPDSLARIAVEGESIGYHYATISDHVVIPRDIEAKYPYSDTGEFPGRSRGDRHEQLTAAAFIAGKTSRLRLVTSVTVVPHRPAVLLAKMLATIDVLSKGRLIFGIGAGWMREEFEALGLPPFAERGAVTDEYLNACRELWTNDDPRFEGRYVKFANILFEPKPVQKPHPPIWVGGESGPALRRTARLGDGWYPIGTNPQHRLDSMKRFQAGVERLRRLTREAGRDPAKIALAYRVTGWGSSLPGGPEHRARRLFSGETADIAADLRSFRDFGVGHVDFNFEGATADAMIANMRRFREDVLSTV